MRPKIMSSDPDILGTWPAMLRAARRARQLAFATGTPLYVWKDGKVVNLNPKGTLRRRKKAY